MADLKNTNEREAMVEFMQRDLDWPYFRLPLKRYNPDIAANDLAFLTILGGPQVFLAAFIDKRSVDEIPRKEYPNYWAIYDDGWRVD